MSRTAKPAAAAAPSTSGATPTPFDALRVACYRFPGVEEKPSYGAPSFHVRGKLFATFSDARDAAPSALVKLTLERQREVVQEDPARFSVPAYLGVKGWVSVRLDAHTDWDELAILLEEAWSGVAPARGALGPVRPPPPPPVVVTTDPAVARQALARVRALVAARPDTSCEETNGHATFKAGKKVVAYLLDNHHGDGIVGLVVKSDVGEAAALAARDPARYYLPAYLAARGWIGVRLEPDRVDWADAEARLAASFAALAAPRPAKPSAAGAGKAKAAGAGKPKAAGAGKPKAAGAAKTKAARGR